jgi:hypothetical protein
MVKILTDRAHRESRKSSDLSEAEAAVLGFLQRRLTREARAKAS